MNDDIDNIAPLASGVEAGPHLEPEDLFLHTLNLMTAEDRLQADEHLEGCAECRARLAAVREDLGEYALAATPLVEPPAIGRERLLAAVSTPPATGSPTPEHVQPAGPALGLVAGGRSTARPSRIPLWLGWGLAAAMALAATHFYQQRQSLAGALGEQSSQLARLNSEQARARAIVDALTDRSAQRVTLNLTKGATPPQPTGRATYLESKGTLIFLASHLSALPAGKTYELWVIPANGTAPVPAGTFHPDASGAANVVTEKLQAGLQAKAFGITIEPEGGSATPTMPIVMAGS